MNWGLLGSGRAIKIVKHPDHEMLINMRTRSSKDVRKIIPILMIIPWDPGSAFFSKLGFLQKIKTKQNKQKRILKQKLAFFKCSVTTYYNNTAKTNDCDCPPFPLIFRKSRNLNYLNLVSLKIPKESTQKVLLWYI